MPKIDVKTTRFGNRTYTIDGVKYPSVTTILGAVDGKPWLPNWIIKEAGLSAANLIRHYVREYEDEYVLPSSEHLANIYKAHLNESLNVAANFGKRVHALIEDFFMGRDPTVYAGDEETCYNQFMDWYGAQTYSSVSPEEVVWYEDSSGLMLAGTVDLVAETTEGEIELLDYKTGSRMRRDYYLQLAAYAEAYRLRTGRQVSAAKVVRINPDLKEAQVKAVPDLAETWADFQRATRWFMARKKYS